MKQRERSVYVSKGDSVTVTLRRTDPQTGPTFLLRYTGTWTKHVTVTSGPSWMRHVTRLCGRGCARHPRNHTRQTFGLAKVRRLVT